MARALRAEQVTPADELRDLLALNEKRIANRPLAAPEAAALLRDLDRILELWPELEARGVDLRPEAGRWETLQAAVRARAGGVLAALRPDGGLAALRAERWPISENLSPLPPAPAGSEGSDPLAFLSGKGAGELGPILSADAHAAGGATDDENVGRVGNPPYKPIFKAGGEAAWWWHLDEMVRQRNTRRLVRTGVSLGVVAIIGVALYFLIFRVLFPVDPAVQTALDAQQAGEKRIANEGDFAAALADFRRAAEANPGDPEQWLRVGVTLEKLGDQAAAQDAFRRAEVLLADSKALLLARAGVYLSFGLYDKASVDCGAVIAADPENAVAHYYMASVYEARGQVIEAIAALERASELADRAGEQQLTAIARYRLGILMQQAQVLQSTGQTPTP